jgi:hypothetical protein
MNIVNAMLWMKRNAYQESIIAKVAKLLRHLQRNCNTAEPEEVKLYVSKKNCSDAHKENLTTLNEEVRGKIERICLHTS